MNPARKILVTGGQGQVGFELQRAMAPFGEVLAPSRAVLDLSDAQAVDQYLTAYQPDWIMNAAAYTAVDRAEQEPDLAHRLNAALPAQLSRYLSGRPGSLVHYSSDYVYNGQGERPWQEGDEPGPLSVYGHTKLAGDNAVLAGDHHHLVFRTSWVYSARGQNFMKTMLRLAQTRPELSIVNDQIGAPTPARLIAQITALSLYQAVSEQHAPLASGVYHLTSSGSTSWFGFAQQIFDAAGQLGMPLTLDPTKLKGIPTREYPTPASRPLNSRLSLTKLEQALGVRLPSWQEGLQHTIEEYVDMTA
ncbi:dTDP-4-dehydrorhamnose reductase [Terasakiispira papahanaumokuakeensis]|uniref:dTDP-4-dehydrorhamnose reductase n=1 Tax=Terasakiispira papahanaumokuakeensis TaxID=197479 RepID=A0A1E2VCV5_9GAMM|nr:dTDP-4-dehydrorhamnose reductase [Terasakiispira papahanaumokuakeensis]ODC04829.1 dTDP-4-dehydrorhamnose reductase [Terasakiispira papahanaumokuakeensis]